VRVKRTEHLFSVTARAPPMMTIAFGEAFTVEVRGAFDEVKDISGAETLHTRPRRAPASANNQADRRLRRQAR
jgi:hypothetical protein